MKSVYQHLVAGLIDICSLSRFWNTTLWLSLLLAGSVMECRTQAGEAPLRVLLLSGQNNHDWRQTTPKLKSLLVATGRFTVEVTEHPERCHAADLAPYDVLLSDWNTFGNPAVTEWPAETRAAFLDFIRAGKGFVVVHAGGSSFYDWPEYQQIAGAYWKMGQTSHGNPHAFTVKPVGDHPITRGVKAFQTRDELWIRPGTDPKATVIATGEDHPIALVGHFGQGRNFALLLGHNAEFMGTPGFGILLGRGTEWAATGKVTLPADVPISGIDTEAILRDLATYRFGADRGPVLRLEKWIASISGDPAAKSAVALHLASLLWKESTIEAKQIVCWQLSLIGSEHQVPFLSPLVADRDLGYYARQALERIPDVEADEALRTALRRTSGETRRHIINSLAARQSHKAVPELAKLLEEDDMDTIGAAVDALGRIGGADAATALKAHETHLPSPVNPRCAAALMRCAEGMATSGQSSTAIPFLEHLLESHQPAFVRLAAFPVYIKTLQDRGPEVVLAALSGRDELMKKAALRALRATPHLVPVQRAAEQFDSYSVEFQVQLISLLGERGERSSIPTLAKAVTSRLPEVRQAAITALGLAGNASVIPTLVREAARGSEEDKKMISESLARLRGHDVDTVLISSLKSSPTAEQQELIRALILRQAKTAVPALLELAQAGEANLRRKAISAVGRLGEPASCAQLVPLLDQEPDETASALAEICRRENNVEPLLEAVAKASPAGKARLLEALDSIGGPQALATVRAALQDQDPIIATAALRALANWPDAAPLEDVLALATTTKDAKCKALALRGVARLTPLAKNFPPAKALEILNQALRLGGAPNEQKGLLAAMSEIPGEASLKAIRGFLNHPELAAEAKVAEQQLMKRRTSSSATPWEDESIKIFLTPENLCRGSVATNLDGLAPDGQGQGPFAAIDGDPRTYWDEVDQQPLYWLRIQLKQPASVACLRILGFQHHHYAPRKFEILCDGQRVKQVENAEYQFNVLTLDWPPTVCGSVELKITGYYAQSPAIRELGLYSTANAKP